MRAHSPIDIEYTAMSSSLPAYAGVVLDANAFISGSAASLRALATSHYTVSAVITEVRDARARALLASLPFELRTRTPAEEDVEATRLFAGHTGDLRALSRNDVALLALARTLEREANGMKYLRATPPKNVTIADAPRAVAAAILMGEAAAKKSDSSGGGASGTAASETTSTGTAADTLAAPPTTTTTTAAASARIGASRGWAEGDDDEGDWAGPEEEGDAPVVEAAVSGGGGGGGIRIGIGLLTTDFAMQNVALQMGLTLLTHSGLAVASVKSWVLKCDACFSIFPMHGLRPQDALFCKRCGSATLNRLGVTLGADGAPRFHYKRFRQINTRGTVYALPAPSGGRVHGAHGEKAPLLLRPDQLLTGGWKERQRLAARADRDAFGDEGAAPPEVLAGSASTGSARGWGTWAGPASGAAPLLDTSVEVGYGRRNPNANTRRKK